ncbi:MAG TPA: hypothetical protein VGI39_09485 [Polyangiaceae bacterium]|jgi:hypothetical protein
MRITSKFGSGYGGWTLCAGAAALLACSSKAADTPGPATPPALDAGPPQCPVTALPAPQGSQVFDSLTASLVDDQGAPATNAPLTVCGFDLCLTGKAGASGVTAVQNAQSGQTLERPALKIGDGVTFAELAYPLPDRPDFDLGKTVAIPLPSVASGAPLLAGASATAGGVTVTLASNAVVTFDALTYAPDARAFRAKAIELTNPPLAIDPAEKLAIAYALVPQGTTFCPPAALDVPNTPGWPAGTEVEVLVHGTDLAQPFAPYGGWAVVATGSVSADGQRVRTAEGSGLPVLAAVGIRRVQDGGL